MASQVIMAEVLLAFKHGNGEQWNKAKLTLQASITYYQTTMYRVYMPVVSRDSHYLLSESNPCTSSYIKRYHTMKYWSCLGSYSS